VVPVADAGLGTINAVRLSVEAFDFPLTVALNRFGTDPLHARNHTPRRTSGLDGHRRPNPRRACVSLTCMTAPLYGCVLRAEERRVPCRNHSRRRARFAVTA
jgi:hypothetical protein